MSVAGKINYSLECLFELVSVDLSSEFSFVVSVTLCVGSEFGVCVCVLVFEFPGDTK